MGNGMITGRKGRAKNYHGILDANKKFFNYFYGCSEAIKRTYFSSGQESFDDGIRTFYLPELFLHLLGSLQ